MSEHKRGKGCYSLTFIVLLLLVTSFQSIAQERCSSHLIVEERAKNNPSYSTEKFEQWLTKANQQRILQQAQKRGNSNEFIVPVVFHIVHQGEAIGTGSNLSESRILEQLQILNDDFNKLNTDSELTLEQFQPVAASMEFKFVLAKQDPNGEPTTGIVRKQGGQSVYTFSGRNVLCAESYWPAEDYLNVWIADLNSDNIGWAEFPVSTLQGLEEASDNRLIDGVTIDYEFIGYNNNTFSFDSYGRTLTHEMGHYFGLRHIWGDGGCSIDDFCADTPSASTSSTGCNLEKTTCESLDMVQNFMDYTDDVCMSLFTSDQKARMHTVIQNSPRRNSLLTSKGLESPVVLELDAQIASESNAYILSCNSLHTPSVVVRNNGTTTITQYTIQVQLDGNFDNTEVLNINTNLVSGEEELVEFSTVNLNASGEHTLDYFITQINNTSDQDLENNQLTQIIQKPFSASLPYQRQFKDGFEEWLIQNPDNNIKWEVTSQGAKMNFFDYENGLGQEDILLSPIYDFTNFTNPQLKVVYAKAAGELVDRLSIKASFNCGESYLAPIFNENDNELATAYARNTPFTPTTRLDWDTLYFDLGGYATQTNVSFALSAINGTGNNLYISEFTIQESPKPAYQLTPQKWLALNPLLCEGAINGTILLDNTGSSSINQYTINLLEDGQTTFSQSYQNQIAPGSVYPVTLKNIPINNTAGNLTVRVDVLQSGADVPKTLTIPYALSCETHPIPFRITDVLDEEQWYILNPDNNTTWQYDADNQAMIAQALTPKENDWLVTPGIDVSNLTEAGFSFEVAYTAPFKQDDGLQINLMDESFTPLYAKSGKLLATDSANAQSDSLIWRREFINLSNYLFKNFIRLAIIHNSEGGHPIYIRNLQFHINNQLPPNPYLNRSITLFPNPASNQVAIQINLEKGEQGIIQLLDSRGNIISQINEPVILNQYITYPTTDLKEGLYFVRVKTRSFEETKRLMILKN